MMLMLYSSITDERKPKQPRAPIEWPDGKRFCFTIFDDTDYSTTQNIRPIYHLLRALGFRTTKSVWPMPCSSPEDGETCADPRYFDFVCELQHAGFEIGMHGATSRTSDRLLTREALEHFKRLFGQYPKTLAQHGNSAENIYWADRRVTGIRRAIYRAMHSLKSYHPEGEVDASPLYWGDLCTEKIKYVRNFVFRDINTLKLCPEMPYHDPQRPKVNFWFASTDGNKPLDFVRLLSDRNQSLLEEEGGACIVYTHFFNFSEKGRVLPEVQLTLERLAAKKGWFVPVATLLDFLLQMKKHHQLTDAQRRRLEWRWLADVSVCHLTQLLDHRSLHFP